MPNELLLYVYNILVIALYQFPLFHYVLIRYLSSVLKKFYLFYFILLVKR